MAVEGFDAREQLAVVARANEDLGVLAYGGLEEGEGAGGEFVGFELGYFVFSVGFMSEGVSEGGRVVEVKVKL
jgi:hypothetical protein